LDIDARPTNCFSKNHLGVGMLQSVQSHFHGKELFSIVVV